jgi:uncharacterized protein (TIGR02246 family)
MKRRQGIGLAVGMWLIIAGCSEAPPAPPDTRAADEKAIRDLEVVWNADFKAKDADKILSHYADSATLMAPGEPLAKGKEGIRASLSGMLSDKNLDLSFATATVEVAKAGDLAYSQGSYTMTTTNAKTRRPVNEKGSYVTVYKKQAGGDWKAVEDINTPGPPAVPAAPAKKTGTKAARRKKK